MSTGFVDTKIRKVVATVKVGSAPQGLAVNAPANLIYVANTHSSSISVIDGDRNRVVQTITTNSTSDSNTKPYAVLFMPKSSLDNYSLYYALEGDPSYGEIGQITVTQAHSEISGK